MQKIRFHDSKINNQNFEKKQKHQTQFLDPKKVVDINKLLNRVKIEEKNKKKNKRFIMLSLKDNNPGYPLLLHEEPIYLNDIIIGKTTSGNYSFNYSKNLSFGYVVSEYSNEELAKMKLYIEVAKQKYPVIVEIVPLKDKQARLL